MAIITQNIRSKNKNINFQELFSYLIDENRQLKLKEKDTLIALLIV